MEKFTFNSGREYSVDGQIIDIYKVFAAYDTTFDTPVTYVFMHDTTRTIEEYMVFYCDFDDITGSQIMTAYDKYQYADTAVMRDRYGVDLDATHSAIRNAQKGA